MKTDNKALISALRILSNEIDSQDGVANACITEAANRIEELDKLDNLNNVLIEERTKAINIAIEQSITLGIVPSKDWDALGLTGAFNFFIKRIGKLEKYICQLEQEIEDLNNIIRG